ncbi:hypothetical protein POL68_16210 [Stigmatella sp. ncwal1]|uniref:Cytochrome c n=1 Tax=Stigmatella ashevillensis TaxID=2995309 RepID=A0ABT5D8M3_9BACT|nr:hypothetical protein [Stigmatella ashevillena]MDC0710020.1 hypothetical protein [Stigmatella ashevillena]
MKNTPWNISLVLVVCLTAGFFFRASAEEPAKPQPPAPAKKAKPQAPGVPTPSLAKPDYLPEQARGLLRQKMERHGQDARDLMFGVTLLQYDIARAAAQRISSEPRLVRPLPGGEGELNSLLPERFFLLQDEARLRARAVSEAAEKRDDKALAEGYGRLVETCVACHSAYLNHR